MNHDAPRDKARVFAGVDHFRQPVERRIGIAAAHGFDERGNGVVVRVAVAVIHDGFLLDALLGGGQVQMDDALRARLGGERGDFQRVEGFAGVAVRDLREVSQRDFSGLNFQEAQAAFRVRQRALQQAKQVRFRERSQFKDLRARDERRVDEEKWIVRGRADEPHDAALDIGQQHVLLRFVEAMDFVNEQDGRRADVFEAVGGGGEHAAHVGHVGFHAAEPLELALGLPRDDLCERGFARARRPVKNQRLNAIRINGAAEQLAGREDVRLPDEFIQRAWTHPGGERLVAGRNFRPRRRAGQGRRQGG